MSCLPRRHDWYKVGTNPKVGTIYRCRKCKKVKVRKNGK